MALRARLSPPPQAPPVEWPWHAAKTGSISAHVLFAGERRMEAETYLSSGYGIRTSIESKARGWCSLKSFATSWQPSRLKGIQLPRQSGTPFLSATQVFDVRPFPRKWLALEKTSDASERFCSQGTIVVTCSGSVGRPTLINEAHHGILISHDLLRVTPLNERNHGWLYAYFLAPQTRAMTKSAHYGHIIKHLETAHLDSLPVPEVDDSTARLFNERFQIILDKRNEAFRLTPKAEQMFEDALGQLTIRDWGEKGFTVRASDTFLSGRRRLEAATHNPGASTIREFLAEGGAGFATLAEAGYEVWVPGRYKRIPLAEGVVYRDSADLLEVNPDLPKRYADCGFGDRFRGRVKDGWILVACSGQVYGIIGSAILATEALHDQVVSNHVLRAAPKKDAIPAGYVVTALSHPTFGRPLVKSLAFGSSVPELDKEDLASLKIVRLSDDQEIAIAEVAERAAHARATADLLEREIAAEAQAIIARFMVE